MANTTDTYADGRQTTSNEERYDLLLSFMVEWLDGKPVSPLQAERFTRRCDALARRVDENPRRMRRTIRKHAKQALKARRMTEV